jgi:hypothetical protein
MRVRAGAALVTLGLVAACGSQVSPEAFYAAQVGTPAASGSDGNVSAPVPSGAGRTPTPGSTSSLGISGAATSAPARGSGSTSAHSSSSFAPTHAATSSTPAPPSCTRPTSSSPTVVVCPSTGLHDGQTVHVYASGFQNAKPTALTKALVVTECADKGNDTQQADCGSLHFVNPDAQGRVDLPITVVQVVGSNKDVCGAKYKCLISVAQPKQPPDYEADQHISFA